MSSRITTALAVDDPLVQDASYRFNTSDRQYIDDQARGVQQHLVNALIRGQLATYYRVDAASATLVPGDVVCAAGSLNGELVVTKALTAALVNAAPLGIVVIGAAPGSYGLVCYGATLPPAITGLAAGAGKTFAILNPATGRLAGSASYSTSDVVLGVIDNYGYLAVNPYFVSAASGGGAAPGGSDGQFQVKNGTALAGTANLSYAGGGLVVNASGFIALGASVASTGNLRLSSTGAIAFDRGGSNILGLWMDTTTSLGVGNSNATAVTVYSGGAVNLSATSAVTVSGTSLSMGSTPVTIGASPATAGSVRLSYSASDTIIGAKDSTATNRQVLWRNAADSYVLGDSALTTFNWSWNAYSLAIYTGTKFTVTANNSGFTAIDTSGNILVLGSASSGSGKCSDLTLAASSTIGLGVGGLTYLQMNGVTSRAEYLMAVGGFGGAANYPLKFAVANVTSANGTVTLTAAQYSCPIISITAGATAAWTLVLPLVLGAEFTIVNGSAFAVSCKGATGATAAAIGTATAAKVVCYDGANYIRIP